MQDKFVGDVGDFGKYGLLRALTSPPRPDGERDLSLGIVWYLVKEDQDPPGAGRFTAYLDRPESFRGCDPPLFDALKRIVDTNRRSVKSIHDSQIFPQTTVFHDAPLTIDGERVTAAGRLAHRIQWVSHALRTTEECNIVFVDPDIGLEVSTLRQHKRGPKYVFFDELLPYVRRGQSLVIYQHSDHNKPVMDQISQRVSQIRRRLAPPIVVPLLFRRWNLRTFFVVPSHRDQALILRRIDTFLEGPWHQHFEIIR